MLAFSHDALLFRRGSCLFLLILCSILGDQDNMTQDLLDHRGVINNHKVTHFTNTEGGR